MKTEMKIKPYHLRFSFVLLLMISLHFYICGATSAKKSNSMISDECNATIVECLADEGEGEEVFLMESETTRRFLAYNKDHLSLRAPLRPPATQQVAKALYDAKVQPTTLVPKQVGSMYTASLYAAFASLIHKKHSSLVNA
ncbi:hypothetical protein TEA_001525 [Camellia sinensis var. sinensis]|uniref:Hydroxymethylglutaryl-coenzyme A synthase C-terminal domain-containing protein n=1 Tax=Camellia sinensis var. sinensis TaxID=542762 RepID=A0A4S4E8D1_CAMSN|nr:hypothetical protein TEA_001525 [Camellia sinensis var. sinensis]